MRILRFNIFSVILLALFLMVSERSSAQNHNFSIGGSGELHYNDIVQDFNGPASAGEFDLHKVILKAGYHFNERLNFHTKFKYEHGFSGKDNGEALFVDRAYADYKVNPGFGIRGGLVGVPLGGSKFKPYNGIETSPVEKYISYSWRELGAGVFGMLHGRLSYEAYLMTGLEAEELSTHSGLYSARKNKFTSSVDNPAAAIRMGYDLGSGVELGVSGLVSGLKSKGKYGEDLSGTAFSLMEGHLVYGTGGFKSRVVGVYTQISGADKINARLQNDLGDSQYGALLELAYDLVHLPGINVGQHLIAYGRGEVYDFHATTRAIPENPDYERRELTFGFIYKPMPSVGFKTDYQILQSKGSRDLRKLNLGIGYYF